MLRESRGPDGDAKTHRRAAQWREGLVLVSRGRHGRPVQCLILPIEGEAVGEEGAPARADETRTSESEALLAELGWERKACKGQAKIYINRR